MPDFQTLFILTSFDKDVLSYISDLKWMVMSYGKVKKNNSKIYFIFTAKKLIYLNFHPLELQVAENYSLFV